MRIRFISCALTVALAAAFACKGKTKQQLTQADSTDVASESGGWDTPSPFQLAWKAAKEHSSRPGESETGEASLSVEVLGGEGHAKVTLLSGLDLLGDAKSTDESGKLAYSALAPGSYQVWASQGNRISSLHTFIIEDGATAQVSLSLEPATRLSGRVHNAQDEGQEAELHFLPILHDHLPFSTQSDESGEYSLYVPAGKYQVFARSKGHTQLGNIELQAEEDSVRQDILLEENALLAGQVTNVHGSAVVGASVQAIRLDPVRSTSLGGSVGGLRWVHPLTQKRFLPIRDSRRFGAKRPGSRPFECGAGHCGVDIGGVVGAPVVAAAAGKVVVSDRNSGGRAGRYVAIEHKAGWKTFYMHLQSIEDEIEVGEWVYAGQKLGGIGTSGIKRSEPHLHFALSRPTGLGPLFVDAEPALRVAVVLPSPLSKRLTDAGQQSEANLKGSLTSTAHLDAVRSDDSGRFQFSSLPPGRYVFAAKHELFAASASPKQLLAAGSTRTDFALMMKDGTRLRGKVRDDTGLVAGADILALQGESESRRIVAETRSDGDGDFRLPPLTGEIDLQVRAAGRALHTQGVKLSKEGWQEEEVILTRLAEVMKVQARAFDGAPLLGAKVKIISGPSGKNKSSVTDNYGIASFPGLANGEYRVEVRAEGHPPIVATCNSRSLCEAKAGPSGTLEVELINAHRHSAVQGVRIELSAKDGESTSLLSDSAGRATFPALRTGSWKLTIADKGFARDERSLIIEEGKRHEERIELRVGAKLAGTILDDEGNRVPGASVRVGDSKTTSDADGRFVLEQSPTGDIEVQAEKDELRGVLSLTVFPGDEYVTLEVRME